MSQTRIKGLQSASSVAEEKFDDFEFVVDSPDPDATLKISGSRLKKCIGTPQHTHPITDVVGLVGELDKKLDKSGGTIKGDLKVEGNAHMKNLRIDEYLEVPELKYNRITATGNELWVTDAGVVDHVVEYDDDIFMVRLKVKEGEITINFQFKDILRGIFYTEDANGNPTGFKTAYFEVAGVVDGNTFDCIALNGIPPQRFMTLARQGNKTDPKRQGSVYLDGLHKYIRVADGITDQNIGVRNIKAQLGDLSGIDHPVFGQLQGYGALLENAYICGRLIQQDPETGKNWAVGSVAVHGEQVIFYDRDNLPSPDKIIITATEHGFSSMPEDRKWQYKSGSEWITIQDYRTLALPVAHDASYWGERRTLTIRYVVKNTYEDAITIAKIHDGTAGADGINGSNGVDGTSQYFHVRYSPNATGNPMSEKPDKFIGTVVTYSPTAPTDFSDYKWVQLEGAQGEKDDQGIAGKNGEDGKTSYLHIKYSDDGGKTFTADNGEAVGEWIGQYVDFVREDSNRPADYTWSKIKGEKGENGISGTNGIDGTSQYFHVRYSANSNGNPMSSTPNTYIGTVVTGSATAPTAFTAYQWTRLQGAQGDKGDQGIAGKNGENGQTSYLHIKYSNDGGETFTANNGETVGEWIGQYVNFTVADSNKVTDYKWTKIKGDKGDKGENGINGTNGIDGTSNYFHVRYSDNPSGNPMSETPKTYIGTVVNSSPTAPTSYTAYKWVRLEGAQGPKGDQGIAGQNGSNGQTSYLHIKYSNDGGKTFTANNGEEVGEWIGQYVDFTPADSNKVADYKWSKIKGEAGDLIYIKGTGYNRNATPVVSLNGKNLRTITGRGHTLIVLKRSNLSVVFTAVFDTHGYPAQRDALAEQMLLFDSDFFQILVSSDSVGWNNNLIRALIFCGSEGELDTSTARVPYAFMGYNGLPKGHALEMQTTAAADAPYAEISTNIINGQFVGSGSKGEKGDKGDKGDTGTHGINGTSQYFHVRYSANANGNPMSATPNTYIGTVVTTTATAPTGYASYKWQRLEGAQGPKGDQGIAGQNGSNGQTSYLHIKYSNDGGATFTANNGETVGDWIGQYVDFTAADSNRVSDYKWTKIKGEKGENGINGTNGIDGSSQYFHVRYSANANGNPMTTTTNTYIGTVVTNTATAPTGYTSYKWQRLEGAQGPKGDQGIAGQNGSNGQNSYLHIKYSNDGGKSFTSNNGEDVGEWIGQYVDFTPTDSNLVSKYTWSKIKGDVGDSITGRMVHRDPEFRKGVNGVSHYNNTGNGNVGIARIERPSDCPTTSTHCLQVKHIGLGSPGYGGIVQVFRSRANAIFIQKIIAKIPIGYSIAPASNGQGSGAKDRFITPVKGTGKYETYIRRVDCGTAGTFSTGGFIYLQGGSAPTPDVPVIWYIASMTAYDMTETENYDDAIEKARVHPKAITYCGTFSATTKYFNNQYRTDCVKYGSSYYMYKGTDNTAAAWTTANWQSFGSQFTSVATGLLLAQLAYITNLGVENLRTNTTGTRIEITKASNGMAFYISGRTTPVVEIKTSSDAVYMGQGSGILVKQPQSNISINNGILQNGSEGAGVSVPIIPWGSPEIISQNTILQSYTNKATKKYKCGQYISVSGTQGTATTADKFIGSFIQEGGMFIGGNYTKLRSNNVLSGVTCAGMVSASGSLLRSWVISFMGGYLTSQRLSKGKYRISFSNTSYLMGANDYDVIFMCHGPNTDSSVSGAYGFTTNRTNSYFDCSIADDPTLNDCKFSFIVIITNKFW